MYLTICKCREIFNLFNKNDHLGKCVTPSPFYSYDCLTSLFISYKNT